MVLLFLMIPGYLLMLVVEKTKSIGDQEEGWMIKILRRLLIGSLISLIVISAVYLSINLLIEIESQGLLLSVIGFIYLVLISMLAWKYAGLEYFLRKWTLKK